MHYSIPLVLIATCMATTALCMEPPAFINDTLLSQQLCENTTRSIHDLVKMQEKLKDLNDTHPKSMNVLCGDALYSVNKERNAQLKNALFDCLMSIKPITPLMNDAKGAPLGGILIDTTALKEHFATPNQTPQFVPTQEPAQRTWQQKFFFHITVTTLLAGTYLGYCLAKHNVTE